MAFAVASGNQEIVADQKTLILSRRFSRDPDVDEARLKFRSGQKVEETFRKEFDELDFTSK